MGLVDCLWVGRVYGTAERRDKLQVGVGVGTNEKLKNIFGGLLRREITKENVDSFDYFKEMKTTNRCTAAGTLHLRPRRRGQSSGCTVPGPSTAEPTGSSGPWSS